jgi:hypothetical protein
MYRPGASTGPNINVPITLRNSNTDSALPMDITSSQISDDNDDLLGDISLSPI